VERKVRAILISSCALVVGASAAYYLYADGSESGGHAVAKVGNRQPVETARWSGQDGNDLPVPADSASKPIRKPRLSPRRAVEVAQQSGLPKDAIVAAVEIRSCKLMAGSAQKLLELNAERGRKTRRPISEIVAPLEAKERMCQELDAYMIGQYEPMLRRAMEGGERGAAALWWITPEAKALNSVDGETSALDALKRDATQCDRDSLATYKLTAFRFPKAFDSAEVAAIYAASAQLVKDRKVKSDGFGDVLKKFIPSYDIETGVDKNAQAAKTAEILNWCERNRVRR